MQTEAKTHTGAARAARGGKQVVNGQAVQTAPAPKAVFKEIELALIDASKTQPRKFFDPVYLAELAISIREQGILEPLLVRPTKGGRFELIAGECRLRAGKLAELKAAPCIVRELSDADAMEIQVMENLHRQNLKPLEEAAAFRALITTKPDKHSAESIGERIGKSASFVWDYMKMLDAIDEVKQLLDQGKISVNHVIPIARLTPAQQKKVIEPGNHGLFEDEYADLDFGEGQTKKEQRTSDPYFGMKARSVKELQSWIHDHIRFEIRQAALANPFLFDNALAKVDDAEKKLGRGKKVIHITFDGYVHPSAKGDEKVFGPRSWKRADGTEKTTEVGYGKPWKDSPTCEFSVLGVVVVGPGYGQTFEVCIAREKCTTHWGAEINARESARKANTKSAGGKGKSPKKTQWQIDNERDEERRRQGLERWETFGPALKKAMQEKLNALPATLPKSMFQKLISELQLPKDTKPERLAQALVIKKCELPGSYWSSRWENIYVAWAGALGVNVKALEPKKEKLQTSGAEKAPAKEATKKAPKK